MSSSVRTSKPARPAASGRLGVTSVASGSNRRRRASTASSANSGWPCFETKTGSTTISGSRVSAAASATASTIAADANIPVLAASTPMSPATARICSETVVGESSSNPETPLVFCTVTAVIAVMPKTPKALNVLRSAWMPAPPPGVRPGDRERPRPESPGRHLWSIGHRK